MNLKQFLNDWRAGCRMSGVGLVQRGLEDGHSPELDVVQMCFQCSASVADVAMLQRPPMLIAMMMAEWRVWCGGKRAEKEQRLVLGGIVMQ